MAAVLLLFWQPSQVSGFAPDTVLPLHTPRDCNCSSWASAHQGANQSFIASLWRSPEAMLRAGAACAFPANAVTPLPNGSEHLTGDGWCLCGSPLTGLGSSSTATTATMAVPPMAETGRDSAAHWTWSPSQPSVALPSLLSRLSTTPCRDTLYIETPY